MRTLRGLVLLLALTAYSQTAWSLDGRDLPPPIDARAYRACGVNCLYLAAAIGGKVDGDVEQVHRLLKPDENGSNTMHELQEAARVLGFFPVAARLRTEDLALVPGLAILHTRSAQGPAEGNHYVLYFGRQEGDVFGILDAPRLPVRIDRQLLESRWTGNTLVLCTSQMEADRLLRMLQPFRVRPWWSEPLLWSACLVMLLALWVIAPLIVRPQKILMP
jgi:ABC-type bacteriocin/lantibiotic exporter with double-glycine peptidase domain